MKKKTFKKKRDLLNQSNVDITSLLDILVILLVFLLSVYSSSDFEVKLVEDLKLPPSNSPLMGRKAEIVQVDARGVIWFNEKKLGRASNWKDSETFESLFSALVKKRENAPKRGVASDSQEKNTIDRTGQEINIVFDESLPYEILHKLMHTSALAGFTEFKFIVKGLE